jgi:hypothetical protein
MPLPTTSEPVPLPSPLLPCSKVMIARGMCRYAPFVYKSMVKLKGFWLKTGQRFMLRAAFAWMTEWCVALWCGVVVRAGQFLSSRADVMPDAYIRELVKLQDAMVFSPCSALLPLCTASVSFWRVSAHSLPSFACSLQVRSKRSATQSSALWANRSTRCLPCSKRARSPAPPSRRCTAPLCPTAVEWWSKCSTKPSPKYCRRTWCISEKWWDG